MKIPLKNFIIVVLFSTQITAQDYWEKVNTPDSLAGIYAVDLNSDNDIFAFAVDSIGSDNRNNMHLFRSTDSGINWDEILSFSERCGFEVEVIVDSSDIFLSYLGNLCGASGPFPGNDFHIYHSLDNGNIWNVKSMMLTIGNDIAISPSGTVYLASGFFYRWDGIIEDWIVLSEDIECSHDHLAVNSRDELYVVQEFFGDSLKMLRSMDGGVSWDGIAAHINEIV